MATKTIAWTTGTGNITLSYTGQGDDTVVVTSDPNDLYVDRSQTITFSTTAGSPTVTRQVTVTQKKKDLPTQTVRLIPSAYKMGNYAHISNASNMYHNTDNSSSYATIDNTSSNTTARYAYIKGFNFSAVPSGAQVVEFTVKLKAYSYNLSTSTSYVPALVNDTTTIGGTCGVITTSVQVLTFTNVTASWDTIKGYGSNFGIRVTLRNVSRNNFAEIYVYGAEIEVKYTT